MPNHLNRGDYLQILVQNIAEHCEKREYFYRTFTLKGEVIRARNCFNLSCNNVALQIEHIVANVISRSCNLSVQYISMLQDAVRRCEN